MDIQFFCLFVEKSLKCENYIFQLFGRNMKYEHFAENIFEGVLKKKLYTENFV